MARKRMIDPGLWDSRQFSQLNFMERVLYVGLISNADDDGRLEDRTALIRSKIFPDDDIQLSDIEDALEHLKEVGLIERYTAGEWDIIQHPKWSKYQTINRPKPSKFPAKPVNHNTITDESLMNHGAITDESRLKEVKGKEVKGKEVTLFVEDEPPLRLATLLRDRINANNPKAKAPNLQTWADAIDKMIRIDGRDPNDIENIIEWCQRDDFWHRNILSTGKLREKYDQLWLKGGNNGGTGKHRRSGGQDAGLVPGVDIATGCGVRGKAHGR